MFLINFIIRNKLNLLYFSIAVLSLIAFTKIFDEFYRLVLLDSNNSAIDLKIIKRGIRLWFSDKAVPKELKDAMYPPASYAMLWPLIGWLKLSIARIVWTFTLIPSLVLVSYIFVKHSLARGTEESFLALIIPLSLNSVGITIGNGQLGIQALVLMIIALLMLRKKEKNIVNDILISIVTVFALIKPSVTAPFFWIFIFVYPNYRIVLYTVGIYLILTIIPFHFRGMSIFDYLFYDKNALEISSMVKQTYKNLVSGTIYGSAGGGYANLHSLFGYLGLSRLNLIASFVMLIMFGFWTLLNRKADFWLLMAVTALFSRFWMYHRAYDDILLIVPMITLFRLIKLEHISFHIRQISLVLLIITTIAMLVPARMQIIYPFSYLFIWGHIIIWLALLFFFLYLIRRQYLSEMRL
jgi:hypothetical protein